MRVVVPSERFKNGVVIAAPHMDDDVLGCGTLMAALPDKERVHVIYATDGRASPMPPFGGIPEPELSVTRMEEARCALGVLGIPKQNAHFLGFPDGRLWEHAAALQNCLAGLLNQLAPACLLIPFRYDRHADHLALNRVATDLWLQGIHGAELFEYFVYYRWHLLPQADIRCYIDERHLFKLDAEAEGVLHRKRRALDCFRSQTTRYYDWQTRPNLWPYLLDEVSRSPEIFLRYHPSFPDTAIFTGRVNWIRLVHRVEPILKEKKDRLLALTHRGAYRAGNTVS